MLDTCRQHELDVFTVAGADTKQAEKAYLARTGSSAWERTKPFSPPGLDTLQESARMLQDFAVAMLTLQPSPDDLILDLGAGGCWCSDLLGRLNRSAVAVDISLDMLRAGRSRAGGTIRAVAGDIESLPFKSAVFQKVVCLSAIHHVPDAARAVSEVARVLTDGGMALFSEPGRGHADAPVAAAAVRDYGVLEQDVLVGAFMRHCNAAGFEHVSIKPLSHCVPAVDLTLEQWDAWTRLAASIRPRRALAKIGFAVAELFGFGKRGPLFEEALAITMVRILRQVLEHHPVIVAAKTRADAPDRGRWRATIAAEAAESAPHGGTMEIKVTAANVGSGTWRPSSRSGVGHVRLGLQLLDAEGRVIVKDFHRVALPHAIAPGQSVAFAFFCPAPPAPGVYGLKCDLVAEGVTWFETEGSVPTSRRLLVV
jgi:SAM-dependent methyltransferase